MKNERDFRPAWHYTPPAGWINDPNGLLWDGRRWHLFAQHTPDKTTPGPMYWSHAVSQDLIRWRELGVALAPDALGEIYSGSAVVLEGKIAALFTHHGSREQQSLAFSEDGIHFRKHPGNPVIANTKMKDFRDPKVLRNEILGGWSMVLAAGEELQFFHSDDLICWEQTGAFGKAENCMGGIFECPDLFPLTAPDGSVVWVLLASMGLPSTFSGGRMQYFLGSFDGHTFRSKAPAYAPFLVDAGQDNYAAVTFFGTEPLLLGWAGNWAYAAQTPTGSWRGCMTLARRLSLAQTKKGLRLAASPVLPVLHRHAPADGTTALPGEQFVLDIEAPGDFTARVFNSINESVAFGCRDGLFFIDRSKTGELPFPLMQQRRLVEGPIRMRAVFDCSVMELFADDGVFASTTLLFPAQPYETLVLIGATGSLHTERANG